MALRKLDLRKLTVAIERDEPGDRNTGEWIGEQLYYIENIRATLENCDHDEKKAKEAFDRTMASIAASRKSAQERCRHYLIEWHADPSGGSDSSKDCLICGKVW